MKFYQWFISTSSKIQSKMMIIDMKSEFGYYGFTVFEHGIELDTAYRHPAEIENSMYNAIDIHDHDRAIIRVLFNKF